MTATTKNALFTRDYFLAFTVLLGAYIVFVALMTFMALYAADRFQVGDTAAGFAASSFVLGAGLVRLVIGKYLDFIGRKRTLIFSLIAFTVSSLLYPLVDHYSVLIILRILQGTAFGIISTAITSVVIDIIPISRRSEGLGYYALAATLGMAIGPFAAVQISAVTSDVWVFNFTALCAAISLLVVLPMRIQEHPPSAAEHAQRWRIRGSDLIDIKVLPVAIVAFLSAIGYALITTYLPPFLVGQGMAEAASLFFIVFALTMLGVRLFAGRIHDQRGENAVIPLALLAFALSLGLLAVTDSLWQVIVAAILGGIGQGGAVPSLQAVGISRTTHDRVPIATSTHYLALDAGIAVGPVALGFTIGVSGYFGLYLAGAAVLLASIGVYWLTHGRHTVVADTAQDRHHDS
ncbi:MFS transporter [Enteractinococcus coprophilus]|nr:MFS transporter [Enteractinococcus coprophilus]